MGAVVPRRRKCPAGEDPGRSGSPGSPAAAERQRDLQLTGVACPFKDALPAGLGLVLEAEDGLVDRHRLDEEKRRTEGLLALRPDGEMRLAMRVETGTGVNAGLEGGPPRSRYEWRRLNRHNTGKVLTQAPHHGVAVERGATGLLLGSEEPIEAGHQIQCAEGTSAPGQGASWMARCQSRSEVSNFGVGTAMPVRCKNQLQAARGFSLAPAWGRLPFGGRWRRVPG